MSWYSIHSPWCCSTRGLNYIQHMVNRLVYDLCMPWPFERRCWTRWWHKHDKNVFVPNWNVLNQCNKPVVVIYNSNKRTDFKHLQWNKCFCIMGILKFVFIYFAGHTVEFQCAQRCWHKTMVVTGSRNGTCKLRAPLKEGLYFCDIIAGHKKIFCTSYVFITLPEQLQRWRF